MNNGIRYIWWFEFAVTRTPLRESLNERVHLYGSRRSIVFRPTLSGDAVALYAYQSVRRMFPSAAVDPCSNTIKPHRFSSLYLSFYHWLLRVSNNQCYYGSLARSLVVLLYRAGEHNLARTPIWYTVYSPTIAPTGSCFFCVGVTTLRCRCLRPYRYHDHRRVSVSWL